VFFELFLGVKKPFASICRFNPIVFDWKMDLSRIFVPDIGLRFVMSLVVGCSWQPVPRMFSSAVYALNHILSCVGFHHFGAQADHGIPSNCCLGWRVFPEQDFFDTANRMILDFRSDFRRLERS